MKVQPFVSLVVEGTLDDAVLRRIIHDVGQPLNVAATFGRRGKDYIRKNIKNFNQSAKFQPYIILVDLDDAQCPPVLINHWLPLPEQNLVFRVAVKEVESWLLSDIKGISAFLGINARLIPPVSEHLESPKEFLVNIARSSARREILRDLVPASGSTSKVGKNYNGRLAEFVDNQWNIQSAAQKNESLLQAMNRIKRLAANL
jgi:hypothetical protein